MWRTLTWLAWGAGVFSPAVLAESGSVAPAGRAANSVPPSAPMAPNVDNLSPDEATRVLAPYGQQMRAYLKAYSQLPEVERLRAHGMRAEISGVEMPEGYTWQSEAVREGLSAGTIERLGKEGVAIGGPYLKESFQVYVATPAVPFITSDSLVNVFHRLLGNSMRPLDRSRAQQLRAILERSWTRLNPRLADAHVPRAAAAPYLRQLALVIGPALRCLGSSLPLGDSELEAQVSAETQKIVAAAAVELPAWLEPADRTLRAIDYRRCRPIGLYAGDPELEGYYRATRWLQMVPFRASRERELGAIGLLADSSRDYRTSKELADFCAGEEQLWGKGDGPGLDLFQFSPILVDSLSRESTERALATLRRRVNFQARQKVSEMNDALRPPPSSADQEEAILHILPATGLPEDLFLSRWAKHQGPPFRWPEGLEVAGWLGSPLAISLVEKERGNDFGLFVVADLAKRNPRIELTLPERYEESLRTLFVPPVVGAPAFMSSEAWQQKSLQTALAGWAQLRHDAELHAKLELHTLGVTIHPAGFVEPNPAFFEAFAGSVSFAIDRFSSMGLFSDPEQLQRWLTLERLSRQFEAMAYKQLRGEDWTRDEALVLKAYGETAAHLMGYESDSWEEPKDTAPCWTIVFQDASADRGLGVAVGRPRMLYVVYPWKGRPVLCLGSVMTYYESPSDRRLTDQEWRLSLDGPNPPVQPDWIQPLLPSPAPK